MTDEELEHLLGKNKLCLTCPPEAEQVYRNYMDHHKISYEEIDQGGKHLFVLDKKYDPHEWQLPELDG